VGLASSTLALRLRRCSEFPGLIPSHELDTLVEAIHRKAGGRAGARLGALLELDLYK